MKKYLAAAAAIALLAGQGAASAQTAILPERAASPIGESEGATNPAIVVLAFVAVAGSLIAIVESGEDDPTSP